MATITPEEFKHDCWKRKSAKAKKIARIATVPPLHPLAPNRARGVEVARTKAREGVESTGDRRALRDGGGTA